MDSLFLFIQALLIALTIPFSLSLILSFFTKRNTVNFKPKKYPPGPKKLPIIGNLHELNDLPHRSLERLTKKHGPIMLLKLGSVPTLVVSSADAAQEIFKAHDAAFSGRPVLYAARRLSYSCASVSFAPYGDRWREIRKIAITELLSAKRVQSFQGVRAEEVVSLVRAIVAKNSNPIDLSELTLLYANDVVCRVAFGKKYSKEKSRFRDLLGETQDLLGGFCAVDFFPWLGWLNRFNGLEKRLEKCFGELNRFYDEVIEEHLGSERPRIDEHEDVVDVLLRVQRDPSQAMSLSNDQIKGVLTDIFIAGTDTAAATLVWVMAELIKNPSIMNKVQAEVREVAKGKGKIFESDLSELNYLKMVIKEGFRLHPPVPLLIPRETTEPCTIGGFEIPSKTRVFVNVKVIGTDPKNWEDPNEFRPERFLGSSVDYRGQHFEFLPFGAGRRGCPGINFGSLMIELSLANLLCRFDWELPHGTKIEDLDMEEAFGITMHKKIPLRLVAKLVDSP